MSKTKSFVVISSLLIATIIGMGCLDFETTDEVEAKQETEKMTYLYEEDNIRVYHDNIQNVTCWKYSTSPGGGISCIPDWMLVPQNVSNNCNCD